MTVADTINYNITRRTSGPNTNHLLKEIITSRYCLALLRFFVVHPNGRFSQLAIIHALDDSGTRPEIETALEKLVGDGVVKTSIENGLCYYLLTNNEPTRHLILNLAEFDWHQFQRLEHYYVADRRLTA
jgi:hypothetical protein